jgi:hypothetical protein
VVINLQPFLRQQGLFQWRATTMQAETAVKWPQQGHIEQLRAMLPEEEK